MWKEVLSPVPHEFFADQKPGSIAAGIDAFKDEFHFPNLLESKITIIGVPEDRSSPDQKGTSQAPKSIRKEFYKLVSGSWDIKISDVGDIIPGRDFVDTMSALEEICIEVIKHNSIPVILGGSSDLCFAMYRAFTRLEQNINLTVFDSRISLESDEETLNSKNFLSHILTSKPYRLFNLSHVGHQSYYVAPKIIDLFERMHFTTKRLGDIRNNINLVEPVLRDSDMIVFSNHVIKMSDARGQSNPTPNGLNGEEFCASLRYAGMSDKLSATGIFDFNPSLENDSQNAQLLAQGIWYFIDGVDWRKGDYPFRSKSDYLKFTVLSDQLDQEIIFYKSPWSERWWMEIPSHPKDSSKNSLISCDLEDYHLAKKGEIPDRYWKAIQKIN